MYPFPDVAAMPSIQESGILVLPADAISEALLKRYTLLNAELLGAELPSGESLTFDNKAWYFTRTELSGCYLFTRDEERCKNEDEIAGVHYLLFVQAPGDCGLQDMQGYAAWLSFATDKDCSQAWLQTEREVYAACLLMGMLRRHYSEERAAG